MIDVIGHHRLTATATLVAKGLDPFEVEAFDAAFASIEKVADIDFILVDGVYDVMTQNAAADFVFVTYTGTPRTGSGADTLIGDEAGDQLLSGAGADRVEARGGNDVIRGLAGNDVLLGELGRDVVDGGLGNDTMTGGSGGDAFLFTAKTQGTDRIADFGADDVLVTTFLITNKRKDGIIDFGSDRDLDFATGGQTVITADTGTQITQLEIDGSFVSGGVRYYVYSRVGSAAGVLDADLLI